MGPGLTSPSLQQRGQDYIGTPAHRAQRSNLDAFFAPRSVAVIGATERPGSVGRSVVANLTQGGFSGKIYPINPKHAGIFGLRAYKSVAELPEVPDLVVIVTPAPTVPGLIRECVSARVHAAVVISAGFRETGAAGAELEQEISRELARGSTRLVGPNCLGVMSAPARLNATFAQAATLPGSVAFLSQSGALLTAILDLSLREKVGFSAFVSTGSMLDVGWGDLIDYFGDDPHTQSIVIYMESVGDARSFFSAAREVALRKPIIVIKAGRSDAGSRAATSHTGALTGSDEVLEAAFHRCGILRVQSIADLFYMAEVLSRQPRPIGPRLTVVTNAGGPGVLATDALVGNGGELATLSAETVSALEPLLPPHWSHGNPIDVLGDADAERYARTLEIAAKDPNSDGMLVILAPQAMTDPSQVAERLKPLAKSSGKPLLASWMGGETVAPGVAILNDAGIPTFTYPDTAARAFTYMWRYSYNLRGLYETPAPAEGGEIDSGSRAEATNIIESVHQAGRALLTEVESKHVLSLYGIPTVPTFAARTDDEAVVLARQIGFPVVLKLLSNTITHKAEVGGVRLNLENEPSVRRAYRQIEASVAEKSGPGHFHGVSVQPMVRLAGYELILGSSVDPQFGSALLFGSGGRLVEVFRDRALALPPLNTTLARRLMEQTQAWHALQGARGRAPVNLAALESLLVRFSQLVVEQPRIKEIDVNPLLASPESLLALDARIVLYGPEVPAEQLPRPAIRPYPVQYVNKWTLKNGTEVTIRPIRPEDEPLIVKLHGQLSERTVYFRYFYMMDLSTRVAHERLVRLCFIDYDREMALVAHHTEGTDEGEIIGVGRLSKLRGGTEAEIAVLVADRYQRQGLGSELLRRLIQVARDEKLERIRAFILAENYEMQALAQHNKFHYIPCEEPDCRCAILDLTGS